MDVSCCTLGGKEWYYGGVGGRGKRAGTYQVMYHVVLAVLTGLGGGAGEH